MKAQWSTLRAVGRWVVRLPGPWSLHRRHRRVAYIKVARTSIFAYHFRINYDLNLETAEFLELGLCDFGEILFSARH